MFFELGLGDVETWMWIVLEITEEWGWIEGVGGVGGKGGGRKAGFE